MAKSSEQDGVAWTPQAIQLGTTGLDLRRSDDPGTMSRLLNARFLDAKTLARRDGHTGKAIQTNLDFVVEKTVTDDWVYGHGTRIEVTATPDWDTAHHPIQMRGAGAFQFNDTDVVWTGDRLLVLSADGPDYGSSPFWSRDGADVAIRRGIPAYLPVQVDTTPPDAVSGDYMDTCLTATHRIVVSTTDDNRIVALVINRETGIVEDRSYIE